MTDGNKQSFQKELRPTTNHIFFFLNQKLTDRSRSEVSIWVPMEEIRYVSLREEGAKERHDVLLTVSKT